MDLIMLYISGKPGFAREVLKQLSRAKFSYLEGTANTKNVIAVWVDKSTVLRDFKLAVGAKLIFKYRLQFISSNSAVAKAEQKANSDDSLTDYLQNLANQYRKGSNQPKYV